MKFKNFQKRETPRENEKFNFFYLGGNHLGNVLEVVSDRKLQMETSPGSEILDYYTADVVAQSDYYPFGMLLLNTNIEPEQVLIDGVWTDVAVEVEENDYRYSFQGQEKDDEIKGKNNSVNYKYRMHDPRIGRFFAVDPLEKEYPWNSSYVFSENQVVAFVELEGLERGASAAQSGKAAKVSTTVGTKVAPSSKLGYIYEVPGERTSTGKPYIGRTAQGSPEKRGKYAKDGRIRLNQDIKSTYNASESGAGAYAEQKAINGKNGITNLDNKINAQNEAKFKSIQTKNNATVSGNKPVTGVGTVSSGSTSSSTSTGSSNTNSSSSEITTKTKTKPKLKLPTSGVPLVGPVLMAPLVYESVDQIVTSDDPVVTVVEEGMQWGGAYMMGEMGAAIGTAICPGAGTLIGGAIGWIAGWCIMD